MLMNESISFPSKPLQQASDVMGIDDEMPDSKRNNNSIRKRCPSSTYSIRVPISCSCTCRTARTGQGQVFALPTRRCQRFKSGLQGSIYSHEKDFLLVAINHKLPAAHMLAFHLHKRSQPKITAGSANARTQANHREVDIHPDIGS